MYILGYMVYYFTKVNYMAEWTKLYVIKYDRNELFNDGWNDASNETPRPKSVYCIDDE